MENSNKIAVITGASRGIGKAIALSLAKKGYTVYATMRDPQPLNSDIHVRYMDVTDNESIKDAVQDIIESEGRIDLLVNNAGYGLVGIIEQVDIEDVKHQFDVNVYGVIRTMQAVLPIMRKQKSGRIINIGSISGIVSNSCLGVYSGTKHALEAISASVASTVFPWNIKVSLIEPGPVATEFADNVTYKAVSDSQDPYAGFVEDYRSEVRELLVEGQDPSEIAELVVSVAEEENPHFRYQTSERLVDLAGKFINDINGDLMLEDLEAPLRSFLNR
ncbi:MAG: SDR family oxidoreductase [Chlamydiota bacterium]